MGDFGILSYVIGEIGRIFWVFWVILGYFGCFSGWVLGLPGLLELCFGFCCIRVSVLGCGCCDDFGFWGLNCWFGVVCSVVFGLHCFYTGFSVVGVNVLWWLCFCG